ncbi:hypothetical protein GOV11_00530 [Candidatus Woesearchaeota archaeon]|nr:hypothetical protein [Candidatus Woesearchaeota archaeon]
MDNILKGRFGWHPPKKELKPYLIAIPPDDQYDFMFVSFLKSINWPEKTPPNIGFTGNVMTNLQMDVKNRTKRLCYLGEFDVSYAVQDYFNYNFSSEIRTLENLVHVMVVSQPKDGEKTHIAHVVEDKVDKIFDFSYDMANIPPNILVDDLLDTNNAYQEFNKSDKIIKGLELTIGIQTPDNAYTIALPFTKLGPFEARVFDGKVRSTLKIPQDSSDPSATAPAVSAVLPWKK